MEAVDPYVAAAVLWLAQTILEVLFSGKMEAWIRLVGISDDTESLKSEIERVEAVVTDVKGRAAENRPLARSLGRLKELLYDADDVVDELDYYRLQHQVEGGPIGWANQPQGTDVNGEAQLVDGSRDNSGIPNRRKRSKAWNEFRITEEDADGKPTKAECIYCHTVVKCETTKGTSVLHNHLKSENCKRKRAAIEQTPNPPSSDDGAQNGATVSTHDSDRRKRIRSDEVLAHNTAANTDLWDKAEICNRIQQTTHQLQKSISEVQKICVSGSVSISNLCHNMAADPCRRTSSLVQNKMYGRVDEKNSIIKCIKEDKADSVTVLPIVGIGGIGKTALAQVVYNDQTVRSQFDHRIWIWVSSNFDEVKLTVEILDFISQEKCVGITNLARLQEILVTHVTSKRTLLILDDVWDDIDDCRWNQLLAPLRSDNAKGNVIIATTRKLSIAKRIGTVEPIKLGRLENDDFWLLFKTCAFGDENYKEHPSLTIIGQQIAKNLQGNPLAAQTAGMLLREHLTTDHWSNILKNEKWKSLQLNGGIMHALKLSYDDLPYYLQQCFMYCSIFPNNHWFLSDELVNIWISQGFVKCINSTESLEEIGWSYLTSLVNLGFFQQIEIQRDYSGNQTWYVIPVLMHDFVRQVSRTFCTTIDGVECTKMLPVSVRHLSIITDAAYHKDKCGNVLPNIKFEERIRSIETQVARLRTLVLFGKYDSLFFQFKHIFQKARCLRLLRISGTNSHCTSFLCDLVCPTHLRYLKLENSEDYEDVSHSPSKFYHLQVLDVSKFRGLATYYNMNYLISLRHINIPKEMYSSIAGIGKMTSLQELHHFSIEGPSGSKVRELQFMNELIQLGISQLKNVGTRDEACGARLRDKKHLEKLHLSWKDTSPQAEYARDKQSESEDESLPVNSCDPITDTTRAVIEGLEPHHNLKHLRISGYSGATLPSWLGTSVTCLQTLHLEECRELKTLPSLGCLLFLTKLELRNMQSLIEVSIPSLEQLVLIEMPKLERCSCNSISDLNSRLTVLRIKRCRVLETFLLFESCEKLKIEHKSWLPRLKELTMRWCPHLKVSNPLPPSSNACELDIVEVSTLPTMKGSTNGKMVIGDNKYEWEEGNVDVYSDKLMGLDDKILSYHNLRSLTCLEIACCQNLSSISFKGFMQLVSLRSLTITSCKDLFSSDVLPQHAREDMADTNFNGLPSLKHLKIVACGITGKWLSVMLRHAPALEEFHLFNCNHISGLLIEGGEMSSSNHASTPLASSAGNPDGTLTSATPEELLRIPSKSVSSLKKMSIEWCKELTFQGGKEGFSGFTSLEELTIRGCPKLIPSLVQKYDNDDQRNGRWLLPYSLGRLEIDGSPETLQPCFPEDHNCLKELEILQSPSLRFLRLHSCTTLEELEITYCESLTVLDGNFPCLRKLVLSSNSPLESLQLRSCTALESLRIERYKSLAAIEGSFSCLRKLDLLVNPRLKLLELGVCTALEDLCIQNCESLDTLQENFTCLRKLDLDCNPMLKSLQLRFSTALEDLRIQNCESLETLEDFQSLRGLRYLVVMHCPGLTPYLERLLSQGYELCAGLERLHTDDYSFLTTSSCKWLTSLQRLKLDERPGEVLTDEQGRALQHLTSLQELRFEHCRGLAYLPVGLHSITSLKRLEIIFCPCISRLPEKGLPPSLEEIQIWGDCGKELIDECRMLATRSSKPRVMIDLEDVN